MDIEFKVAISSEGSAKSRETIYKDYDHHCPSLPQEGNNMYYQTCCDKRAYDIKDCQNYPDCKSYAAGPLSATMTAIMRGRELSPIIMEQRAQRKAEREEIYELFLKGHTYEKLGIKFNKTPKTIKRYIQTIKNERNTSNAHLAN